ncbi:phage holin family protein [Chitinibacter sp. SCUT-21]|uniref:phage holin family protein n=1 Tax=Chitinibacter sp. SCUT-21 TaxID=2970891 RepID=UPI0035A5D877
MSSIREALGGLIATRVALFGHELRDELDRVAFMIGLAVALACALILMLSFFGLTLLFSFWAYRILICAITTLVFLTIALVAWWKVRQLVQVLKHPFPLTCEEFVQDRQLLKAVLKPNQTATEEQNA